MEADNRIAGFRGRYLFLSNFAPCFGSSVEHFYQAAKTDNLAEKAFILDAATPAIAKSLGKSVTLKPDWDVVKLAAMKTLLQMKFSLSQYKYLLRNTGEAELIESNYWHDNFWGDCRCLKCEHIEGQNHLGKLLMEVRDELNRASTVRT